MPSDKSTRCSTQRPASWTRASKRQKCSALASPAVLPRKSSRNKQAFLNGQKETVNRRSNTYSVVEAIPMKGFTTLGTAVLFLGLAAAVPAFAQEEQHEQEAKPEKQAQQAKPAQQEKQAKPEAQAEQVKPAQQEKQ